MNILLLGSFNKEFRDELEAGNELFLLSDRDDEQALERISDVDLVIIRSPHHVTDDMIRAATRLKWILRAGSGTDNISPLYQEKGVELTCFPANSRSVAELVLGMIFSLYRNLILANESISRGEWIKTQLHGREVLGKTIGISGFGNIGQVLGNVCNALGMLILVNDRSLYKPEKRKVFDRIEARAVDFETLLRESDIVVLSTPLTKETRHMINRDTLKFMKTDGLLINVGRGGLVDTDALYEHLHAELLAGAGLDTHEQEPPSSHPIYNLPQVISSPHIGAQTLEAKTRIGKMILSRINEISVQQCEQERESHL